MNETILQYLIEIYIRESRSIMDTKYISIIKDIKNKTHNFSCDDDKISIICKNLGPCTLITYQLYHDIIKEVFASKHIKDDEIGHFLMDINDTTFIQHTA